MYKSVPCSLLALLRLANAPEYQHSTFYCQEFVPHGRSVLAKHPGQIYGKHNTSASENSLLYKLSNFAIKDESMLPDKEEEKEWWTIREVYYRESEGKL